LEDEDVVKVIQVMVRKGEESLNNSNRGRVDLVEKEKKELDILNPFTSTLSQEEILKIMIKVFKRHRLHL